MKVFEQFETSFISIQELCERKCLSYERKIWTCEAAL